MKVYFINGLGVDSSVFRNIELDVVSCVFLEWIQLDKHESMSTYARKFMSHYQIESGSIIVGLSFGGMLAQEMRLIDSSLQVILLSSSHGPKGFTWYLTIFLNGRLYWLLPDNLILKTNFISYWLFGVETDKDRRVLKSLFSKMDAMQVKRMIHCIALWNPKSSAVSYSIHGVKDRLLKCTGSEQYLIEDAGHFAVFTHSDQVTKILKGCVQKLISSPVATQEPLERKDQYK